MIPVTVPSAIECSATGGLRSTDEYAVAVRYTEWQPISYEGTAVVDLLAGVVRRIKDSQADFVVRDFNHLADVELPLTRTRFAEALFPNSRNLTRAERREFDALSWPELEPIDVDD